MWFVLRLKPLKTFFVDRNVSIWITVLAKIVHALQNLFLYMRMLVSISTLTHTEKTKTLFQKKRTKLNQCLHETANFRRFKAVYLVYRTSTVIRYAIYH